ncbi:MAG: tail fiber domain-containing protein [Bacteroidales bacterium]|nr:tail fiber domain-containing protein [Bacteroidales bacterium]
MKIKLFIVACIFASLQVNAQVENFISGKLEVKDTSSNTSFCLDNNNHYAGLNVSDRSGLRSANSIFKINQYGKFGFRALPISEAHFYFYGGTTKRRNVNGYYTPELTFELYNNDPRIYTKAGAHISFYNTFQTNFVDIQVRNCYEISDVNTKTNIANIDDGLNKILQLRGVTYNWINDGDNGTINAGLISQEVELIIPEIVCSNDTNDVKLLSYTGLIPYLIEAIKEQQLEIEHLKDVIYNNDISRSVLPNKNLLDSEFPEKEKALLYQNNPNPFIENTNIKYYIPNESGNASIMIFNLQGSLLKTIYLHDKGFGNIIINGGDFEAGMYVYSLIVNGKETDTKRMILTD